MPTGIINPTLPMSFPKEFPLEIHPKCIFYHDPECAGLVREKSVYQAKPIIYGATYLPNLGYKFDASDDYLCYDYNPIHSIPPLTISVWFKSLSGTETRLFSNRHADNAVGGWDLYLSAGGIGFRWGYNNGSNLTGALGYTPTYPVNDGYWHNIIVIVDSLSIWFVVDGYQKSNVNTIAANLAMIQPTLDNELSLGTRNLSSYRLDGCIGICAIYNTVLSEHEIKQIYDIESIKYKAANIKEVHTGLPTLSISTASGQSFTGASYTLTGTCTDSIGIKKIYWKIGSDWNTYTDVSFGWGPIVGWSIPMSPFPIGPTIVYMYAEDSVGNKCTNVMRSVVRTS